jgi:hypothetical protein
MHSDEIDLRKISENEMILFKHIINNNPSEELDGLSPNKMHQLLYNTFDKNSPVRFRDDIKPDLLHSIPFFELSRKYLEFIQKEQLLKLTPKGNLPRKICTEMYNYRIIPNNYIEKGIIKLSRERDWIVITTIKIVNILAGLTKKRNNKISLTRKGENLLSGKKRIELFKTIFKAFILKFNWAFNDMFDENQVGQLGIGYTMRLVSRYGDDEKLFNFYSDKYLLAFPKLLECVKNWFTSPKTTFELCFYMRSFDRFLAWFNFIQTRTEGKYPNLNKYLKKTPILEKIFEFD